MYGHHELYSFMEKFINLLQSGFDAQLHFEAHAGQAHVRLQAGLGQLLPPQPAQHQEKHRRCHLGLSRLR